MKIKPQVFTCTIKHKETAMKTVGYIPKEAEKSVKDIPEEKKKSETDIPEKEKIKNS